MIVDFSFCLIFNKELNFSRTEPIFFREHKLLPVQLTWLLLVYGKMLYFPRHPLLSVYVDIMSTICGLQGWHSTYTIKCGCLGKYNISHTPEEAMSVGLVKACVLWRNWFCSREIEFFLKMIIFIAVCPLSTWLRWKERNLKELIV